MYSRVESVNQTISETLLSFVRGEISPDLRSIKLHHEGRSLVSKEYCEAEKNATLCFESRWLALSLLHRRGQRWEGAQTPEGLGTASDRRGALINCLCGGRSVTVTWDSTPESKLGV
jgi:hypothetical protein